MQTPVLLGLLQKMAVKAPCFYPQVLVISALNPPKYRCLERSFRKRRPEFEEFFTIAWVVCGEQLLMVDGNGILHPRGDPLSFLSI